MKRILAQYLYAGLEIVTNPFSSAHLSGKISRVEKIGDKIRIFFGSDEVWDEYYPEQKVNVF